MINSLRRTGSRDEVDDIPGNDFTVRHHYDFAIRAAQGRGENLHVQHGSRDTAKVNVFTGAERAEDHQQDASGKVRQRALQRQTNG